MYFPYLRGRQYELLALRELANEGLLSKKVIPIIEPIKATSTFSNTIKTYKNKHLPLALVVNPEVGEIKDTALDVMMDQFDKDVFPALIMLQDSSRIIEKVRKHGIDSKNLLVVLRNYDSTRSYSSVFSNASPLYTLFPDEREIRRSVRANKVLFEDKFRRKDRNVEYLRMEDEFFSTDHLFFKEEGYSGFGDYSIVGDYFHEGGQAPYAVVIHIVYFNEKKELRIHHFVSDSNEGPEDVAGKYGESVRKIRDWVEDGNPIQYTRALSVFLHHADTGYYPGLPTIKKLSIMHHLELMNSFLSGEIR